MNPWALVILGIGVLLIIMGVKGSYENVVQALTGHKGSASSSSGSLPFNPLTGPILPHLLNAQMTPPGVRAGVT